jgi:hypothetical protein
LKEVVGQPGSVIFCCSVRGFFEGGSSWYFKNILSIFALNREKEYKEMSNVPVKVSLASRTSVDRFEGGRAF